MKTPLTALLPLFLLMFALPTTANSADKVDFETQIKPFFAKYCVACHGEEEEEAFRIDVDDDMLLYVNEGNPESSDLYTYMTLAIDDDDVMPPVDSEPRPEATEIQLVKTWIEQGASLTAVSIDADADNLAVDSDDADQADQAEPVIVPVDPQTQRIYNAIGSLHTAAIHLPIGLLLAAGLFALLSLGGSFVMTDCAYYCLWLGTFGAIIACLSGWFYSPMENRGTVTEIADLLDQQQPVFWHRIGGLAVTVVAVLICLFAKGARDRNPDDGVMWKLGAIILAGGIGWVGHTGGELTYGEDHYEDLNALVDSFINPKANADGDADASDEDAQTDDQATDSDEGAGNDVPASDSGDGDLEILPSSDL